MTSTDFAAIVHGPVIAAVVAHAATATPGVVRTEPGLRGLLSTVVRAGRYRWTGADRAPADGVRVRRTDSGLSVSVDITIAASGQAGDIGCAVQDRIVRTVRQQTGEHVTEVHVCILDIDPAH